MSDNQRSRQIEELTLGLPGLEISEALELLGGNVEIYFKFLRKFYSQYKIRLPEFHGLLEAGNLVEAHRFVHGLKSLAGNLGAPELRSAAIELEKSMARGSRVPREEDVEQFVQELSAVLMQVGIFLDR